MNARCLFAVESCEGHWSCSCHALLLPFCISQPSRPSRPCCCSFPLQAISDTKASINQCRVQISSSDKVVARLEKSVREAGEEKEKETAAAEEKKKELKAVEKEAFAVHELFLAATQVWVLHPPGSVLLWRVAERYKCRIRCTLVKDNSDVCRMSSAIVSDMHD